MVADGATASASFGNGGWRAPWLLLLYGAPTSSPQKSFSPPFSCSFSLVFFFGPGNHLLSTIRVELGLCVGDFDTGRNWWGSSLFGALWCCDCQGSPARAVRGAVRICTSVFHVGVNDGELDFWGSGFLAVLILCD